MAIPIQFSKTGILLKAPGNLKSLGIEVGDLPVEWNPEERSFESVWELSDEELERVLRHKCIRLKAWTPGQIHPVVAIYVNNKELKIKDNDGK